MPWPRILSNLIYPPRVPEASVRPAPEEIDAWVEAVGTEPVQRADDRFVERALGLGVTSGMILDLNSRLGLVTMKILWREESFLGIGVYGSLEVSERARHTAEQWELGERMFFQVGQLKDLGFKDRYFDMVISDRALHLTARPAELLKEIGRISKPGGAILLGQRARPWRLGIKATLAKEPGDYPALLRGQCEARIRSGYTRSELQQLIAEASLEGARVVGDGTTLFIERPGSNDPASWVSEREKYD